MKIGIIRIDRMGDMILTLPIIKSIKSANPSAKIDVFASNANIKIINDFKYINKIINIDKKNYFNRKKYDLLLNFSPGWKSFYLCFFSKSSQKINLILSSRYTSKFYSKILIRILSKIVFNITIFINRLKRFEENQSIHQTQIMFNLLDKCGINYKKNILIEEFLPKIKILKSNKRICLIHLSSKWINEYYNEDNFLDLLEKLKDKFNIILTSDETTRKKFKTIFNKFKIIRNNDFKKFETISNTVILENLDFQNWTQSIYSSNLIITPECGCSHMAALCNIPSKIIYDPNNNPNMIYAEYSPWQSKHKKYVFNKKNLNLLLSNNL